MRTICNSSRAACFNAAAAAFCAHNGAIAPVQNALVVLIVSTAPRALSSLLLVAAVVLMLTFGIVSELSAPRTRRLRNRFWAQYGRHTDVSLLITKKKRKTK